MAELELASGLREQAHMHIGRRYRWLPFWLLLPSIAVLLALQVLPTLYSFYLSTTRMRRGELELIGLRNFETLFARRDFWLSLEKTLIYAGAYVLLTVCLGLMIALLLNRRIKYTGVYLVFIFIPWIISEVVVGTMWRWLFQPSYGIVQNLISTYTPFLGDSIFRAPGLAMGVVIGAAVWRGLAFTTLLSLGALQTVPQEILESASLDGANRFRRFFSVILPIVRPTLLVMILLTSIQGINSLGLIVSITRGEPAGATRTASYYLIQTGWQQGDFGMGAAISVILFFINITLTLVYIRVIGRKAD
jgi:multiple sugar transport system permease protein